MLDPTLRHKIKRHVVPYAHTVGPETGPKLILFLIITHHTWNGVDIYQPYVHVNTK
jgi:hypothetical protein